ncbi:MAG: MFS transporter [SAR202 cluster bacterium]|nr:MFS transporter [SAR202 cluster bacterium]
MGIKLTRGWLMAATVFAATGFTIGTGAYAFGLFVQPLENEFGWSRTAINASLSFAALSGLVSPIAGYLMDRHGARPVLIVSVLLMALSYLLRPLMSELWHWYALSVLFNLGFPGATSLAAGRLVAIWFPKTRGRVMGVVSMGNNFGGLTLTPLASLVVTTAGWQYGYGLFGLLAIVIALLAFFFVHDQPRGGRPAQGKPAPQDQAGADKPQLQGFTARQAFRTRAFYSVAVGVLLGSFTYSAVLPQIIPHLENVGMSSGRASLLLSLMALLGLIGKGLFGYLSDKLTALGAFMVSLGVQVAGLILIVSSGSSSLPWVIVPFFGLGFGAMGALIPLTVQEIFGVKAYGSIAGMVNVFTVVSYFAGPIMVGAYFDATGDYKLAFLTVAGLFFLGIMTLASARLPGWAAAPAEAAKDS